MGDNRKELVPVSINIEGILKWDFSLTREDAIELTQSLLKTIKGVPHANDTVPTV